MSIYMLLFYFILLLFNICLCKNTDYLFYSYKDSSGKYIVLSSNNTQLNPVNVPNWGTQAYYNASQNLTGWDIFEVITNPKLDDIDQAYQAGYIEGYLTRDQIWNYYWNNADQIFSNKSNAANPILKTYFDENFNYIYNMTMQEKNLKDPYWYQVMLLYKQLRGVIDGYNTACKDVKMSKQQLNITHFMYTNFLEDLQDMIQTYITQNASKNASNPKDHANKTHHILHPMTLEEPFDVGTHCSALIKVVPGNSDVFISHDTWSGFNQMNRILKRYKLAFKVSKDSSDLIPGMNTAFSSYPGVLSSVDDFYVMNSGIVSMETTNEIYNKQLFKSNHPQKEVIEEFRSVIANRLATNGTNWMEIFKRENSGTYNNQWMIIDLNHFRPGFDPTEGFLTVMEQAPGLFVGQDQTNHILKYGYWASYNIPFYPDMYKKSGNLAAAKKNSWNSYTECPRAKIFAREQSKVVDMESMIWLMRYNYYQNDSYSICEKCNPKPNACNAIASRCDLNPASGNYTALPSVKAALFGATDTKIISYSLFSRGELLTIGGPTTSGVTPFSWSKTKLNKTDVRHLGQPDEFNFEPIITSWLLPHSVRIPTDNGKGNENNPPTTTAKTEPTKKKKKNSSSAVEPVSLFLCLSLALWISFKAN